MAINPNAKYIVTQKDDTIPDSTVLTTDSGLTNTVADGAVTLSIDGNLLAISNLTTSGIVSLTDVATTVQASTKSIESNGTIVVTNERGINANFAIDALDNESQQLFSASYSKSAPITNSKTLNFIDSSKIKLTLTDNVPSDRVDVTVSEVVGSRIVNLLGSVNANIADVMTMDVSFADNVGEVVIGYKPEDGTPGQVLSYNGTKVVFADVEPLISTLTWVKDPALDGILLNASPTTSLAGQSQTVTFGFSSGIDVPVGSILGYYLSDDPLDPKNNTLRFMSPGTSPVTSLGFDIAEGSTDILEQTTAAITTTGTFELNMKDATAGLNPQAIRVINTDEYDYDEFVTDIDVTVNAASPILNLNKQAMTTAPSVTVGFNATEADDGKIISFIDGEWTWGEQGSGSLESLTLSATTSSPALTAYSLSSNMPVTTSDTLLTGFNVLLGAPQPTRYGSCIWSTGAGVVLSPPPSYFGQVTIAFAGQMTFPVDAVTMTVYNSPFNNDLGSLSCVAHGLEIVSTSLNKEPVIGNLSASYEIVSDSINVIITSDDPIDAGKSFTVIVFYKYPTM